MERNIKSIHDSDLELTLARIKLLEPIQSGKIKCVFCEKTITLENFFAVFYRDEGLKVVCDDLACSLRLNELLENRKVK